MSLNLKNDVLNAVRGGYQPIGDPGTKKVNWSKPPITRSNVMTAKIHTKLEDIIDNLEQANTDLTFKLIDYIKKADLAEKEAKYFKDRYEELVELITSTRKVYRVKPRKVKQIAIFLKDDF